MAFLKKILGESSKSFTERDNMGTRLESVEQATAYWDTRQSTQKFDPYLLYEFDKKEDVHKALLELACIHLAKDTGNLICTELLIFGFYRNQREKYEAIICGKDLTREQWGSAKKSFIKHNGKRLNDKEPEIITVQEKRPEEEEISEVEFLKEERQEKMGQTMTYRIYKAANAASAKEFLKKNPVDKMLYYIVVETPEGNFGRDIQGIYEE